MANPTFGMWFYSGNLALGISAQGPCREKGDLDFSEKDL